MTKTEALRIARHLIRPVFLCAAKGGGHGTGGDSNWAIGPSKTYGFKAAVAARGFMIKGEGEYRNAVAARREAINDMVGDLMDGTAPAWATMDFRW